MTMIQITPSDFINPNEVIRVYDNSSKCQVTIISGDNVVVDFDDNEIFNKKNNRYLPISTNEVVRSIENNSK